MLCTTRMVASGVLIAGRLWLCNSATLHSVWPACEPSCLLSDCAPWSVPLTVRTVLLPQFTPWILMFVISCVWMVVSMTQMFVSEWISAHHLQRPSCVTTLAAIVKWLLAPLAMVFLFVVPALDAHLTLSKKQGLTYQVAPKSNNPTPVSSAHPTPNSSCLNLSSLGARDGSAPGSPALGGARSGSHNNFGGQGGAGGGAGGGMGRRILSSGGLLPPKSSTSAPSMV